MKDMIKRKKFWLGAAVLCLCLIAGIALLLWNEREPKDADKSTKSSPPKESSSISIWILGDSLAARHNNAEYSTQGWGDYLQDYLKDSSVVVRNVAASGASSISYTRLDLYSSIFETDLQAGDYVIIQFGINDAGDAGRYTDPYGDSDTRGSFQYVLKHGYIEPVLKKGGHVILSTSVRIVGGVGGFADEEDASVWDWETSYFEHVRAMRKLAEECEKQGLDVMLLDTYDLTTELYREIGIKEAVRFHGDDMVHYSNYGASYVAGLIAEELKKLGVPCCQDIRSIEEVVE